MDKYVKKNIHKEGGKFIPIADNYQEFQYINKE